MSGLGAFVRALRRPGGEYVVREGYRGINVVCDGPAENVPEPGGLPGAEPLGSILVWGVCPHCGGRHDGDCRWPAL